MKWYKPLYKSIYKDVSVISIALLSALAISYFVPVLFIQFSENSFLTNILSSYSVYILGCPIFLIITKKIDTYDLLKNKLSFKELLLDFSVFVLFIYVGSYIGQYLTSIIEGLTGYNQINIVEEFMDTEISISDIIFSVILGPLLEELVFRKRMINILGRYSKSGALLLSAICFSMFHGNFSQIFYAFTAALVLGYIYLYTGRIIYTFAFHAVINFFGSYFIIWLNSNSVFSVSFQYALTIIYGLIIIAICIIGFLYYIKKYNSVRCYLKSGIKFKFFILNPWELIYLLLCLILSIFILVVY